MLSALHVPNDMTSMLRQRASMIRTSVEPVGNSSASLLAGSGVDFAFISGPGPGVAGVGESEMGTCGRLSLTKSGIDSLPSGARALAHPEFVHDFSPPKLEVLDLQHNDVHEELLVKDAVENFFCGRFSISPPWYTRRY